MVRRKADPREAGLKASLTKSAEREERIRRRVTRAFRAWFKAMEGTRRAQKRLEQYWAEQVSNAQKGVTP